MSIDTYVQLRTPLSAEEVRAALLRDPDLADLSLADRGDGWLGGELTSLVVTPWEENDNFLIDNGFETGSVTVTLIPGRGEAGWNAHSRARAAVLRLVPGDVCAAQQDNNGPGLLRLDRTVYLNPNWIGPENLTAFGYHPERIVVGIPAGLAATAA